MSQKQLTGKQSDFLKIVVATAARGDLEATREFVDNKPEWIHTVGSHGRTMLWESAYRGKQEVVQFLVEQGADVNICGCHYTPHLVEISPYCAAQLAGRHDVAAYLLENGATVDIHSAAYLGDLPVVDKLLNSESSRLNHGHWQHHMRAGQQHNFYLAEAPWATPLGYALAGQQKTVAEFLIQRGAEVTLHSKQLLGFCVSRDRADLAELLLRHGADASQAPVVSIERPEISALLRAYGVAPADLNAKNRMGWPPLVYACRGDKGENPNKVRRLISLGADVGVRNYKGKTALHCAAKAGFVQVMKLLLDQGADMEATDQQGETPLFDAIRSTIKKVKNKRAAITLLITAGANINQPNHKGQTVWQVAKRVRSIDATEILKSVEQKT